MLLLESAVLSNTAATKKMMAPLLCGLWDAWCCRNLITGWLMSCNISSVSQPVLVKRTKGLAYYSHHDCQS